MKQVLIISGKGGTGKTTLTAALADLASSHLRQVLADADVDAANLELLLKPRQENRFEFRAGKTAVIDYEVCIDCGRCMEVCRFDAIRNHSGQYLIQESMCEGCASCFYQCPVDAIRMVERVSGEWYRSSTEWGMLFHAALIPGEENSGKLVTLIKDAAVECANEEDADLLLVDGPPGIGCPVTAACRGADAAVIVTEPTVSGVHDLERVLETTNHFGIPAYLVINKFDLNLAMRGKLLEIAHASGVPLLGEIPYDERIMAAQSRGMPVTRVLKDVLRSQFEEIWYRLREKAKI